MGILENGNLMVSLLESSRDLAPYIHKPKDRENRTFIETNQNSGFDISWHDWGNKTSFVVHKLVGNETKYEIIIDTDLTGNNLLDMRFRTPEMGDFTREILPEYVHEEFITALAHHNS